MGLVIVDPLIERAQPRLLRKSHGYSQFGEHVLIDAVLGKKTSGFAAEIGAGDGKNISNTLQLEERGWKVLCVEPNPLYRKALKKNRKFVQMVACGINNGIGEFKIYDAGGGNYEACSALSPNREVVKISKAKLVKTVNVKVRTLDSCLERAAFSRLDLLSIDVEGGEADVLAGFSIDRWRPKIVIIEDWKGCIFRRWFCKHGYYVLKRLGPNEVFVRA